MSFKKYLVGAAVLFLFANISFADKHGDSEAKMDEHKAKMHEKFENKRKKMNKKMDMRKEKLDEKMEKRKEKMLDHKDKMKDMAK